MKLGQWLLAGALAGLGFGCQHSLRLVSPNASPGAKYVCQGRGNCVPAEVDVPEDKNASGTEFITLPRQCGGRIYEILIENADSSDPKVWVVCAPEENPIETM